MMSDITLCTPDFMVARRPFRGCHGAGRCPGACLQAVCGIKRGNYMMFMVNGVDAKTALDWGIVNEILPEGKAPAPRLGNRRKDYETAPDNPPPDAPDYGSPLEAPPHGRLIRFNIAIEMYGGAMRKMKHHFEEVIKENWSDKEKKTK